MQMPELEAIIARWEATTFRMAERPRQILGIAYQYEKECARVQLIAVLTAMAVGSSQSRPEPPARLTAVDLINRVDAPDATQVVQSLCDDKYLLVFEDRACQLSGRGYAIFESQALINTKLILGLYYLCMRGIEVVHQPLVADLVGLNTGAAGHHIRLLERYDGLLSLTAETRPGTQKRKTDVTLTDLGVQMGEYLAGRPAASVVLKTWVRKTEETLNTYFPNPLS